ncbi:N-acyl-D-amino-acid deacylase family protein [Rufibacter quisquiliarum]|uniref:N-acyl-D-aspartate/D-glutamate deacylase n=1 Tax=Rufibacter quisquiliarum TaxID=1549639 RepID=A0A839GXW1_9BACT|nr:D-aminoacylase [Rufibacter quisquiliarum]MBA9079288.1 N-acyl-D-aspartate/D-glutamate deacylase [Rufibacter quisquiliarum]
MTYSVCISPLIKVPASGTCLVLLAGLLCLFQTQAYSQNVKKVDTLIKGAWVFDGSGKDSVRLDVGITGDRITYLEPAGKKVPKAKKTIAANGYYLAPGFIDPHTHVAADLSHPERKSNLAYLMQGVTTVFEGNDGSGPMPIGSTLAEWEQKGIGTNAGLFVGHGSVRKEVLGEKDVQPTPAQLDKMKKLVAEAMEQGAYGISTGLFYAPGSFARQSEVVELSKVAAAYGGIYDTHLRDESTYNIGLMNSIKETLEIGEAAGIPVHISHIKALGADVWGKSPEVIQMIEAAQQRGLRVTANQYPYLASRTNLIAAVVPRWAEDGGVKAMFARFDDASLADSLRNGIRDNIRRRGGPASLVLSTDNTTLNGKSLEKVAQEWQLDPVEAVFKVLRTDQKVRVVSFNMTEEDLLRFMKQPWVMTGSDGTPGHPRKYGSFTRKLKEYAIDHHHISMANAIHSSTGLTAQTLGIQGRGLVKKGYYADLILFQPQNLKDFATYEEPSNLASGMDYVFVNGVVAVENGKATGALAGKALKHKK